MKGSQRRRLLQYSESDYEVHLHNRHHVTEPEPGDGYSSATRLLLRELHARRRLVPDGDDTAFTHEVTFPVFRSALKARYRGPGGMDNIRRLAVRYAS